LARRASRSLILRSPGQGCSIMRRAVGGSIR
jgi:hypothetical protein